MNTFSIHRLTSCDTQGGLQVVQRFKGGASDTERMRRLLLADDHYLVIARDDATGEVIGFAWAYKLQRLAGKPWSLFLYEIEVADDHRRRGIGRALIGFLRDVADTADPPMEMFVLTNHSNHGAVAFYTCTGGIVEESDALLFVYPADDETSTSGIK